jgi:predicted HAD superfamily Cof-like phosphohydrolase
MSDWYQQVKAFMEGAGQHVPDEPMQMDRSTAELRARLILEEAFETVAALGIEIECRGEITDFKDLKLYSTVPPHVLATVDGLCDIMYVTIGTFVSMGLPADPFMQEVCQNNMTKVCPRAHIVAGKVQKPADYQPPKLSEILLSLYTPKGE